MDDTLIELLCFIANSETDVDITPETLNTFPLAYLVSLAAEALPSLKPEYQIMLQSWLDSNVSSVQ